MRRALVVSLILLASVTFSGAASATLLVYMTDEELTARADAIVLAEVTAVESYRDARLHRVFTRVTLGVEQYLKGQGPGEILVRVAGGTLGDLEYRVLGAPRFQPGEQVVLFLAARPEAASIIGMTQGKLRVVTDEAGQKWVERDLTSVALTSADGRPLPRESRPNRMRLSDLRASIDRVLPLLPATPERALSPAPYAQ
ncbi:MAG: hypothetical protein HY996_05060 [Micrococcales bacterium]|nr:hypothetical protein [Micrococcales bacterium]